VIMAGIFGIEGRLAPGSPEHLLRQAIRGIVYASTMPFAQIGELMNLGKDEPVGMTRIGLEFIDRPTYAVIRKRRKEGDTDGRRDILSLLIEARTEEGEALTDHELRNELLTLVLAGHETTANQLAWTWERLVRAPQALERLSESVRGGGEDGDKVIDQTIHESMRSRPVIPTIGRRVAVPWRLGEFGVDAGTPVVMSIALVHHREDLYPDPFSFRPERWEGHKPGTYEWIPFGGGIRRCLGAALAMAEQRIVLRAMAGRLDLEAAEPEPERALHRNVTMIPAKGGRVVIRSRR
jgi:cytochrome P450